MPWYRDVPVSGDRAAEKYDAEYAPSSAAGYADQENVAGYGYWADEGK